MEIKQKLWTQTFFLEPIKNGVFHHPNFLSNPEQLNLLAIKDYFHFSRIPLQGLLNHFIVMNKEGPKAQDSVSFRFLCGLCSWESDTLEESEEAAVVLHLKDHFLQVFNSELTQFTLISEVRHALLKSFASKNYKAMRLNCCLSSFRSIEHFVRVHIGLVDPECFTCHLKFNKIPIHVNLHLEKSHGMPNGLRGEEKNSYNFRTAMMEDTTRLTIKQILALEPGVPRLEIGMRSKGVALFANVVNPGIFARVNHFELENKPKISIQKQMELVQNLGDVVSLFSDEVNDFSIEDIDKDIFNYFEKPLKKREIYHPDLKSWSELLEEGSDDAIHQLLRMESYNIKGHIIHYVCLRALQQTKFNAFTCCDLTISISKFTFEALQEIASHLIDHFHEAFPTPRHKHALWYLVRLALLRQTYLLFGGRENCERCKTLKELRCRQRHVLQGHFKVGMFECLSCEQSCFEARALMNHFIRRHRCKAPNGNIRKNGMELIVWFDFEVSQRSENMDFGHVSTLELASHLSEAFLEQREKDLSSQTGEDYSRACEESKINRPSLQSKKSQTFQGKPLTLKIPEHQQGENTRKRRRRQKISIHSESSSEDEEAKEFREIMRRPRKDAASQFACLVPISGQDSLFSFARFADLCN